MAAKHILVKVLSALEVEEKMELGLCFLCDEPFTLEHQLLHKNIRISVVDVDEEVEPDCESPSQQMNFSRVDEMVQDDESLQLLLDRQTPTTLPPKSHIQPQHKCSSITIPTKSSIPHQFNSVFLQPIEVR
jgi:hypothetical protein